MITTVPSILDLTPAYAILPANTADMVYMAINYPSQDKARATENAFCKWA